MNPSPTFLARFALLAVLVHTPLIVATPLPWSINRYQHTAFTKRDGAPTDDTLVVQSADGFLWTADTTGIVRYDGFAFRPFVPFPGEHLLGRRVHDLFAPKSGGLWFSYIGRPGVSFIKDGHITNYDGNNGWQGGLGSNFLEDRQGRILVLGHPGVLTLADGTWRKDEQVEIEGQIEEVVQDNAFNIWALTYDNRILFRADGETQFKNTGTRVEHGVGISSDGKNNLFVSSSVDGVVHRFEINDRKLTEIAPTIPFFGRHVLVDQHQNVWIATAADGVHFLGALEKLPKGDRPFLVNEKLNKSFGLTGNGTTAALDRSGNVWVSTEGGLDRFVPSAFSQVTPLLPEGIKTISFTPGAGGEIWIGSETKNVIRFSEGTATETSVHLGALATFSDEASGTVYAATPDQLWKLAPGDPVPVAEIPGPGMGNVSSIARDSAGNPWLVQRRLGWLMWDGKTWQKHEDFGTANVLVTAASGVMWAGYRDNRIASYDGTVFKQYAGTEGVAAGTIKTIAFREGHPWFGGDQGVQAFDGARFTTLRLEGDAPVVDVSGLVFDRGGNLWIHTLSGLIRVPLEAIEHAVSDSKFSAPFRLFDESDGVPANPQQAYGLPTIVLGNDGRLWISGQREVAWLATDELPAQPVSPTPLIERATDGSHALDTADGIRELPAEIRNLSLEYTAPELTFPSRVRFQYRLDGLDTDWQEAGNRRIANYGRLPAGKYAFNVRTSIGGKDWKEARAPFQFTVAPAYYERWWFRGLVLVGALLVAFVVVRSLMNLASAGARRRTQIRSDEREAVARDIHDTLLQTTQTLLLRLTMLGDGVVDETAKRNIAELAASTREAIVEGRGKVKFLRTQTLSDSDAISRVIRTAASLSVQHEIAFHTKVAGHPRTLSEPAAEELVPILSEALNNAFVHAKATTVTLSLAFGFWKFVATVLDDGIGIDEAIVQSGAPEGHWGIRGTVERTKRIGGRLRIEKRRPQGTKVEVSLLMHRAYVQPWERTKRTGAAVTSEPKQQSGIKGEADI